MNLTYPSLNLGRKLRSRECTHANCGASSWERWWSHNSGVLFNGSWCCREQCLRQAMNSFLMKCQESGRPRKATLHRFPLGLLLLSRGEIDELQLATALRMKTASQGKRVGECLRQLGAVGEEQVTRALGAQNGLPVLLRVASITEPLIPLRLLQASEAWCFRTGDNSTSLYAGFSTGLDQSFISAVENVLGVAAEPCIVPGGLVMDKLAMLAEKGDTSELVFDAAMLSTDIVDCICSYARQLEAESIRMATTRNHIWARIQGLRQHDLVFRNCFTD